jgi:hypothetical protein
VNRNGNLTCWNGIRKEHERWPGVCSGDLLVASEGGVKNDRCAVRERVHCTYRLVSGTREVHGLPVLVVSSIAAAVMVLGALILGGDEDDEEDHGANLNMRAVLLDTAADADAAAAVAFTGAIILATKGNYWLDSAVALVVSAVIAYHAVQLPPSSGRRPSLRTRPVPYAPEDGTTRSGSDDRADL